MHIRHHTKYGRYAKGLIATAALWLAPAAAAPAATPTASYSVKPACAPPAPGYAACLGLLLVPSAAGSATGARPSSRGEASPAVEPVSEPKPVSPAELHRVYELPLESSEAQTIAIVDAYDDPNAQADLGVFDAHFGLPACTHENGCFTKVNQQGTSAPLPPENGEWSIEISTDIQVAHSLCENCHIVLVEASTAAFTNLEAAENTAASLLAAASPPGAPTGEISDSWGGEEPSFDSSAFNHPGIVITASAGDSGYLNWDEYETRNEPESQYFEGPSYPASSPRVVAVGGTTLTHKAGGEWLGETVWNDRAKSDGGGGGCSAIFVAPLWQAHVPGWPSVGCGSQRAVADVAADADPRSGVRAYDSVPLKLGTPGGPSPGETGPGEIVVGGTSVASPIVASAFALAGGAHGVPYPAATLYAHNGSPALHDITVGGNGECEGIYNGACNGSMLSPQDCGSIDTICNAVSGYDGPTGVGTPIGLAAFQPVPGEIGGAEEKPPSGPEGGLGGGQEGIAHPGGGSGAAPPPSPPPSTATPPSPYHVWISGLSLTFGAVAALNRNHPPLSRIAFSFNLSATATVRVTLARWGRVHGHGRWIGLQGANTLTAHRGANHARLRGRGALGSGRYRLTLTPAGGPPSSIVITIG